MLSVTRIEPQACQGAGPTDSPEPSPAERAWCAFDAAALELHSMYDGLAGDLDRAAATSRERFEKGQQAARLWRRFMALAGE